ncbi:MAG: signal recognition particle protein, partial [Planctomycetota bacterium]
TLDDFRNLMMKMAKPGLLGKMMSLLPGMAPMKEVMGSTEAQAELKRTIGCIDSMTMAERRNPKLIDASRRTRIANGAGVQTTAVSGLIKQFETMKPIMKAMAGGGAADKAAIMQQMQQASLQDPTMRNMKVKQSTGKRLTKAEKEKMRKEREKERRKRRRNR